ncbi:MAG TPA: hypothetical protein EYP23_05430 [Thermoplasmata archaeon]|nr:hypothetical protein [Thermoplasmata archaeon]
MKTSKLTAALGINMLLLLILATNVQSTSVISTTHDPATPTAGLNVTFYATVENENISQVTLWIEECSKTICRLPKEVAMTSTGDSSYATTYKLRKDSTYFRYKIVAQVDGEDVETEVYNITVNPYQNNGTSGGESQKTPGFEVALAVTTLAMVAFIVRKRS